eukprot:TRINITY_DN26142_c0_g1_i2.p1 TRINITY_DN26142_c0_g1~~TRINITY_DN26142_c0_g1_i2.p1  ORF type:complete len:186 (+),score=56.72 TRINITY_DN26142_c0_g1_i2:126-683(+)
MLRSLVGSEMCIRDSQKAVDIDVALADDSHHQLAMSLNALATCYAHVGQDEQSAVEYERAVEEYRVVLANPQNGDESHYASEGLSMALSNRGMVLAKLKRLEEAKSMFEESVSQRESGMGRGHESTLRTLRHLLQVYELLGDQEAADRTEAKLAGIENELAEDQQVLEAANAGHLMADRLEPKAP